MSSITSGRRSANSAVSSSSVSRSLSPPALDRARSDVGRDRDVAAAARSPARDERPVLELDRVEHALRQPVRVDVLRIDAEPLGQGVALRCRRLRTSCGLGNGVLRRDVVAVRGQAAEVGGALATSGGHQSERFGGIWIPTSGISRRHSATRRFMSSTVIGVAQSGSGLPPRPRAPSPFVRPAPRRGRVGNLRDLPPVVVAGAGRSSGGSPPGCGRGARARRPAPRATRSARPRSRRCRPGCRS